MWSRLGGGSTRLTSDSHPARMNLGLDLTFFPLLSPTVEVVNNDLYFITAMDGNRIGRASMAFALTRASSQLGARVRLPSQEVAAHPLFGGHSAVWCAGVQQGSGGTVTFFDEMAKTDSVMQNFVANFYDLGKRAC